MKESGLRLKKKLQSKAGETIAETLVTMIILSLAVLMLAGAVVTTARVNKQADNPDTSFQTRQTGAEVSTGKVIISDENATGDAGGTSRAEIPVRVYQSQANSLEKSYIYYKTN